MLWCGGNPISSRQIVELISILNFDRPPPGDKLFDSRGEAGREVMPRPITLFAHHPALPVSH